MFTVGLARCHGGDYIIPGFSLRQIRMTLMVVWLLYMVNIGIQKGALHKSTLTRAGGKCKDIGIAKRRVETSVLFFERILCHYMYLAFPSFNVLLFCLEMLLYS
jgi:hypothetical protein